jgi:hypothetical protein
MQLKKPSIPTLLPTSTFCLHRERHPIDRTYQREEGTWEPSDEQYLIDTILRGFAMPPVFLHIKGDKEYIVDGQQRLNAVWRFKDGIGDPSKATELSEKYSGDIIKANNGKKKYSELKKEFQDIFDTYPIPIMYLRDYEDEEIRDLFRRLQHGKPLNVGEILNAQAGKIVPTMRTLAEHKFFKDIIAMRLKRYKHYHLSAILMYLEKEGIKDISPHYLYEFFEKNPNLDTNSNVYSEVVKVLNYLSQAFNTKTGQLHKDSWIVTLYLLTAYLIRNYVMHNQQSNLKAFLADFYQKVVNSSKSNDKELIDFNLAISRGTTSQANIKLRHEVMLRRFLNQYNPALLDENRLFTHDQKLAIFHRDNEQCQVCKKTLTFGEPETHYHHKDRYVEGGKTEIDKGLLVCRDCHLNKIHGKGSGSLTQRVTISDENTQNEMP